MKFEIEYTRDFVRQSLPLGARRLLEIGCGSGDLAASLLQDGFHVVAVDSDPSAVATAQSYGVDARVAAWPDFESGAFDAVLFTRSLHHIHPLQEAVRHAANCLIIGGRLIVEDFACETPNRTTLQWFGRVIDRLEGAGLLLSSDDFMKAVRAKSATVNAWRKNHEPELHTAAAMLTEIRNVFGETRCEEVPYYFRYLCPAMVPSASRNEILQDLAEEERGLIEKGRILALGRRFVAQRRNKS